MPKYKTKRKTKKNKGLPGGEGRGNLLAKEQDKQRKLTSMSLALRNNQWL